MGGGFLTLSPLGDSSGNYSSTDISFWAKYPLPSLPVVQATMRLGWMNVNSQGDAADNRWDHIQFYGSMGAGYSTRFSKQFEAGAEMTVGLSQSLFQNLGDSGNVGTFNFIAFLAGKLSLNPSYSMSIDIQPNLRYQYAFNTLEDFNGFSFGVGFGVNYRFGEDPDSPQAIIRSIRFGDASIPPLFAALQYYYTLNPIGTTTITNSEDYRITDIEVSFYQEGFMDNPTACASIPELAAGETKEIELFASFNQQVFTTEGTMPLNGEIVVSYSSRGKAAEQTNPVQYDLYDKTAMTWDDDNKVAAYVTPADGALRNYTSYIRQVTKDGVMKGLSAKLQIAMQIFYGLKEQGMLYQADPTSPFTLAQENPMTVDSVNLPRDTLKRATGDCDDLTVLYCTLLETVGIDAGFITVPGHIYPVFNSGLTARDYRLIHPDKGMTINLEGELWIPVEITIVGKDDFLGAWRSGIEYYTAQDATPQNRGFYKTKQAQITYRPVGLRETDLGLQYGNEATIQQNFEDGLGRLVDAIILDYEKAAEESGKKQSWNQLGIIAAEFERYSLAERAFNSALNIDRNYINAKINLGNLYYLQGRYQTALRNLHGAEEDLIDRGRLTSSLYSSVLLNVAQTYYELENFDKANEYYEKLKEVDSERAKHHTHLGENGSTGGRA
jgi:tetratricopeptide (TPR) repeat protein